MGVAQFLKTRISLEQKKQVQSLVRRQLITESIWLKRLVVKPLSQSDDRLPDECKEARQTDPDGGRQTRLYVRLCAEDRLLLNERAAARSMAPATYVSVLVRVDMRSVAPLPKAELQALKGCIAELKAIGRNLNQIARAAHQGGRPIGPGQEHFRAMLKVCEGLRDHVHGLLQANRSSWVAGHAVPRE